MALSYRQIKDLYDTLADAGATSVSLPEWSEQMNQLTGSDLYGEGLHDNFLKRTSVGIDRLLEATGLPTATESFGRSVGSLVGNPEAGAEIGHSLPRMTANFLPMLIPGVGPAVRLGGTALLSGIDAYTSTGSPAAGVVSGVTNALLPKGTDLVEQYILKKLGAPLVQGLRATEVARAPSGDISRLVTEQVKRHYADTAGQSTAAFLGGQAAASGALEAQRWGQEAFAGEPLHNPFTTENLLNLTLGQVPFAATHLAGKVAGAKSPREQADAMREAIAKTDQLVAQKRAQEMLRERADIENVPIVPETSWTPEQREAAQTRLNSLRERQAELVSKPAPTPEDAEALNAAIAADDATPKTPTATSALGAEQRGDYLPLVGKQLHETAKWRKILVADDEANPPEFRGMVVEYSKGLREPPTFPIEGSELAGYGVTADPLWRTVRTWEEEQARQAKYASRRLPETGPPTGELPVQPKAVERLPFIDPAELDQLTIDLEAAKTPAQLQKVLIDLQRIQEGAGREPFNDIRRARVEEKLARQQPKRDPSKAVLRREIDRARREDAAHEETIKRSMVKEDKASADITQNRGTMKSEGGAKLVTPLPKLDDTTEAIHDFVDEVITGETATKDAEQAFALWRKNTKSKDVTSIGKERERFKLYWRLKQSGEIGAEETLTSSDAARLNEEFKSYGIEVENAKALEDYPERDHVLNWNDAVTDRVGEKMSHSPAPQQEAALVEGDPSRAPDQPRVYSSDIAGEAEVISKLTTDGVGLMQELATSTDPEVLAIANDLLGKFPEALARIDSAVYDVDGSHARRRPAGRVGIFLDRSIPAMQKYSRDNVILHEVVHGLTLHELANPKVDQKVVAELTALRERLVEALPKKLREAYDVAQATDWYSRFANGQADMQELHPNSRYAQILYGLLNNDEAVTQGFSSRDFREYMQSVGGKKSGAWKTFTKWVKNLVGVGEKVSDTAFADFLNVTNQLMGNGEYLASFSNFGERFFEARGQGGSYGRAQTQRALGLIADSAHGIDEPLTIATSLDLSASRNTANLELRRAKREFEKMSRESPEDNMHTSNVFAELGHQDADSVVTSVLGEGQDISAALDILPPEAARYIYERVRDAKDVLDVANAAASDKNRGFVNLANPKLLKSAIAPVLRNIESVLAHEDFALQMSTDLARLSQVAPEGFADALPHMAPKAFEDFIEGTKDVGGRGFAKLAEYLEPVGQWARRVPEVAEAVSKGFQLQANKRKMFHEAVKWLGMDTSSEYVDVLTKESVHETEQALANPKLNAKISGWMFENNSRNRDAVTMLPDNDPAIAKLLNGLTDQEKSIVRNVVAKAGKVTQMMNAEKLEKMNQIASTNAAALAALSTGLKTKDNVMLSARLLDGIQKSQDPMTQMDGQVAIQSVQQRMQPEAFFELYDFLKGESDKIKLWKQYFDANPFWATAQRTEQYLVKALNKAGKKVTLQASTPKEARDILAKKGYKLVELEDQWAGKDDEPFALPNMSPEMAKRMQEIEGNQLSMLSKVLSPEDLAEVKRTSAVGQVLREATAQRSIPGVQAPPRLLSQGAEELPWMWNHLSWAQRESNYWSRQLLKAQARTYAGDVEVRSLPEAEQKKLKTHFDNLLTPDPQLAQKLTRLNSTWFLGFNLATTMINAAQPFTTHVSEMTALTGKTLDSYKRVMAALNEVGGFKTGKDWANKEHEWLHGEAIKDGEVGIGMFDDEAAVADNLAVNFKRLMKKNSVKTLGQRLQGVADNYATAGMWVFKHAEKINAEAALIAGYDFYREQGLSKEEAKVKAYEYNHAVNYGGGRAQRAVGIYSSRSPFLRGAAMLGTSLQSYVLGTTSQIARYLQKGFFRPDGLTPAEKHGARKAALQMLATQFGAAGLLGMPFVSGALALLDKEFPELELNRNTREFVNSFLSGDEENGSILTDMAMTGVPSMLGWDMQSRLSMGNTLPGVSEVNGFQPENLMGPTANLVRNFVNGTEGWLKGDAKAGLNFLPPAVKKVIEAGRAGLGGQGIRDYRGRPLDSPTPGELTGSFLGFQPKRLSDQNAASRMLKQSEEVLRTQESRFRTQQAELVLAGNFGTVRQELRARMMQSKDYDAAGAVQAIARAAEELTFPRDLRREGTQQGSSKRNALLASYGGGGQGKASEVQRLQFRSMIEQKLGVVGDNRRDLQVAGLMDQMAMKDPNATRLQLKAAASEALRRSRPRTLQLPEEFQ